MAKTFQIVIEKRGKVTNGDVLKAVFPNAQDWEYEKPDMIAGHYMVLGDTVKIFNLDWWNAPYREENNNEL